MTVALASDRALTITNPLVLYRALIATKKIEPDPAQHRLAIHLQKLYHRLKDYEPQIEYRHKLNRLSSALNDQKIDTTIQGARTRSIWSPLLGKRKQEKTDSLALVEIITDHESALKIDSPKGLLLHGEVGTGKSMLVDLLADSLPNRKKRRWHFNTFMLETFTKLERLRVKRHIDGHAPIIQEEHSLLSLARDMITTSPILFLDEFQLPDRAASKILSNLFTSFFHLGGVLIATSNRMPEELAKASGVEFVPPPSSLPAFQALKESLLGKTRPATKADRDQKSDFAAFLDVLRARCEVWDMEGERDWRRREPEVTANGSFQESQTQLSEGDLPKHYHLMPSLRVSEDEQLRQFTEFQGDVLRSLTNTKEDLSTLEATPWEAVSLRIYGRELLVPRCLDKITLWSFPELCAKNLGPADYISLASTFHTLILTDVPVLSLLEKNEARRFITLLDALYEARCKLLLQAEAGPDDLFFPETQKSTAQSDGELENDSDETYAETFSEIYQDQTSPFRPNISAYTSSASTPDYDAQPLPRVQNLGNSANPNVRSILADEDSDFGPTYGAGRSFRGDSSVTGPGLQQDPFLRDERSNIPAMAAPNFQKASIFTGEDERFAYKRARSRLWEMCSERWWNRSEEGWWKPVSLEARTWESSAVVKASDDPRSDPSFEDEQRANQQPEDQSHIFRHGASPFRTSSDPPPRISWVHAWGVTQWGKKAGDWGKGTEKFKEIGERKLHNISEMELGEAQRREYFK